MIRRLIGVAGVAASQFGIQVISALTGLLLLRWISVEDYAQYTFAFSFGAMLGIIADAGISATVMPLVGDRIEERATFARYVRSALALRMRAALVLLAPAGLIFALIANQRGWTLIDQILLFATVLAAFFAAVTNEVFASPLLMHRQLQFLNVVGLVGTIGRFLSQALLHLLSLLNGIVALALNVATLWAQGAVTRRAATPYLDPATPADRETEREIRARARPIAPAVIFTAIQGQIVILLGAAFGDTRTVADLGALSRLAFVFGPLGAVTALYLAPRVPQLTPERLARDIPRILAMVLAAGTIVTAFAFAFPGVLLLLLGGNYSGLHDAVGPSVLAGTVAYFASVLYSINLARQYVWLKGTLFGIFLVITCQGVCIALIDLKDVVDLQILAIAGIAPSLVLGSGVVVWGIRHELRAARNPTFRA